MGLTEDFYDSLEKMKLTFGFDSVLVNMVLDKYVIEKNMYAWPPLLFIDGGFFGLSEKHAKDLFTYDEWKEKKLIPKWKLINDGIYN